MGQRQRSTVRIAGLVRSTEAPPRASRATLRLWDGDGHLRFEVIDDGVGFDTDETSYGTGLQGMIDRLAAVGGELHVRSVPGTGTTVTGGIPLVLAG
jgi:signal transduction histidine kinase